LQSPLCPRSGGFFDLRCLYVFGSLIKRGLIQSIFASFGDHLIERKVRSEGDLVIDLCFGEQNVPFVTLLPSFFGFFATKFLRLFLLLRFEPNFCSAPFGSELSSNSQKWSV
jgi:hypothetical protein